MKTKILFRKGFAGPFRINSWYIYARDARRNKIIFESGVDKFDWNGFGFKTIEGWHLIDQKDKDE